MSRRGPREVFNSTTNKTNAAVKESLMSFLSPPTHVPLASELKNVYNNVPEARKEEESIVALAIKENVPQLQLEQIDIEASKRVTAGNEETSVLIPDYITGAKRDQLILRWKSIVSGQAFTGSYLELYAQKWIDRARVWSVYDCQRDPQKSHLGKTFEAIFLNSNGWQNRSAGKKTIFLKSKWNLSKVNSDPAWAVIKEKAKGSVDVEPDIIICDPAPGPGGTVWIVEMKIGNGKKDSGEEYNQLCRVKKLFNILWNEYVGAEQAAGRRPRAKPVIKMMFVGWAAKTNDDVVFTSPGRTMGRDNPVKVPYYNNSGGIPEEWRVYKGNAQEFGKISGVRADFITKIIQELNWLRAKGFYEAMEVILKNTQLMNARQNWLAQLTHETRGAVLNRKIFNYLTPLKRTAVTATEASASNIEKVVNKFRSYEAMRRNLLNNAKQYNTAKVQSLVNILKQPPSGYNYTPNHWTVFGNYASNNNRQLRENRGAQVVSNLVRKGVSNQQIKNAFKNVKFPPPNSLNSILRNVKTAAARAPVMAARAKGKGGSGRS
jgi:hypothetical protein